PLPPPPRPTLFPYTTLFRSLAESRATPDLLKEARYGYVMDWGLDDQPIWLRTRAGPILSVPYPVEINDLPALVYRRHTGRQFAEDRKSTRLNSSHLGISYAV